jgi:hypothetical protein
MRGLGLGLLLAGVSAFGQVAAPPAVAAAPVPRAMATAKTVFVSNAGVDAGLFPHPFSGGADRAYNEFYAELQAWGRFKLVGDPSAADLVLELRLTAPNGPQNADKSKGASDPLPMFRVAVIDRATHFDLWAVSESVDAANRQKTHDKNFDDAINSLVEDLKHLFPAAH